MTIGLMVQDRLLGPANPKKKKVSPRIEDSLSILFHLLEIIGIVASIYNNPHKRVILSEVEALRNVVEEPRESHRETSAGFFDFAALRSE